MKPADPRILALNGGSSSIKVAVFEAGAALTRVLAGQVEGIGQPEATLRLKGRDPTASFTRRVQAPGRAAAVGVLMDGLAEFAGGEGEGWSAVGHRLVHGGPRYCAPQPITPGMVDELRRLSPFDPDHLPEEILLIEAISERFPAVPQVACFDTAFHHDMPRVAQLLAIPRRYQALGVRRYGFHGLSYAFLMEELARLAGGDRGRVVLAHLGNGASLAAVRDGRPVDTSMGFTPVSGVPMGTRSGDLDPGLFGYLARTEGCDAARFHTLIHRESGLLGVSETSSDMRQLLAREGEDVRAAEAIALFCYEVKKRIGAFAAALGGLDTVVFAGGIGESSPVIRERICAGLGFLGLELDADRNFSQPEENAGLVISAPASRVTVHVIKTNEELMIAKSVCQVLDLAAGGERK